MTSAFGFESQLSVDVSVGRITQAALEKAALGGGEKGEQMIWPLTQKAHSSIQVMKGLKPYRIVCFKRTLVSFPPNCCC